MNRFEIPFDETIITNIQYYNDCKSIRGKVSQVIGRCAGGGRFKHSMILFVLRELYSDTIVWNATTHTVDRTNIR